MPVGIVQFYLKSKDYGFIRIPETREEIYFSGKTLNKNLVMKKGLKVCFEIIEDKHGLEAVNIRLSRE